MASRRAAASDSISVEKNACAAACRHSLGRNGFTPGANQLTAAMTPRTKTLSLTIARKEATLQHLVPHASLRRIRRPTIGEGQ